MLRLARHVTLVRDETRSAMSLSWNALSEKKKNNSQVIHVATLKDTVNTNMQAEGIEVKTKNPTHKRVHGLLCRLPQDGFLKQNNGIEKKSKIKWECCQGAHHSNQGSGDSCLLPGFCTRGQTLEDCSDANLQVEVQIIAREQI